MNCGKVEVEELSIVGEEERMVDWGSELVVGAEVWEWEL